MDARYGKCFWPGSGFGQKQGDFSEVLQKRRSAVPSLGIRTKDCSITALPILQGKEPVSPHATNRQNLSWNEPPDPPSQPTAAVRASFMMESLAPVPWRATPAYRPQACLPAIGAVPAAGPFFRP